MALITMEEIEGVSPVFNGKTGHAFAKMLLRITGIDRLAERYAAREDMSGPDFVEAFLSDMDFHYEVEGLEHLKTIENGPFITISNHPYGGLDGLILIDLFGHFRSDYKVMANKFLSLAKTIKDCFISVVPITNDTKSVVSENQQGLRKAIQHIKEGHPMGLFPAGAVSDYSFKDRCVRDRQWQESAVKFIRKMKVPVLPVHFLDKNSWFYYSLGLIDWRVRTLRLPREILNKVGKTVRLRIGEAISVEEQLRCTEEDYGLMIRNSVYNL